MKQPMFSIRDSAADLYMAPFNSQTFGTAQRAFEDEVNNPNSVMHKHPRDYELFHIGEFDADTGTMISQQPRSVARAVDVTGEKNETQQQTPRE